LEKIEVMPGINDLLEKISEKKIPLALASSSESLIIDLILSRTGLKNYFMHLVSCEEVGKAKPEPDIYLHTARLLSVAPEECLVIEDSPNGMRAAKSANMVCIAYHVALCNYYGADESINDFSLMPEILKKYGILI
jgi:HAD superfamily hydrolase (TIGR01509 family)